MGVRAYVRTIAEGDYSSYEETVSEVWLCYDMNEDLGNLPSQYNLYMEENYKDWEKRDFNRKYRCWKKDGRYFSYNNYFGCGKIYDSHPGKCECGRKAYLTFEPLNPFPYERFLKEIKGFIQIEFILE